MAEQAEPSVPEGERGSGTALMLGVVGVGLALLLIIALLVSVVRARAIAQTGADLAALAAATAVARPGGGASPCDQAARAAAGSGATLTACVVEGAYVQVTASRATPIGDAVAHATAGPAAAECGLESNTPGCRRSRSSPEAPVPYYYSL